MSSFKQATKTVRGVPTNTANNWGLNQTALVPSLTVPFRSVTDP